MSARTFFERVLPPLFLLAFYWPGLTIWFYQDDFGWLNLRHDVHSAADIAPALFAPKAHGNMRPLGENAYWLGLSSLFGAHPLPFRVVAFATQIASLVLLGSIVRQLTSSAAAGFWAQILWIANSTLAAVMCWSSIYNQALSGFFFLLALYFLLRRSYTAHWIAFVLGIGALETNVMYPAIAGVYALLFDRALLKKVLPMFPVSALAVLAHFRFAPAPHSGPYALHVGASIFSTLWTYWSWSIGAPVLTVAVAALVAWKARQRDYIGLFAVAWFVIVLAPYLLLPDHMTNYYAAIPSIGLAILGGWAIACARPVAVILCVGWYLWASLPAARTVTLWSHARAARVEDLVLGVAEIHTAAPKKIVLLAGVDTELFWSGIVDVPFRAMEIPSVYLAPGSEAEIQAPPDLVGKFVLPQGLAWRAMQEDRAVAYRMDGSVLRNATYHYSKLWKPEAPRFVNLADSLFGEYFGAGWTETTSGRRSMTHAATLRIGGPRSASERLYIGVFRTKDFDLGVSVDGIAIAPDLILRDFDLSEFRATLPVALVGKELIEVALSSNAPESLEFGFLEVR